jgi:hypothetical protein
MRAKRILLQFDRPEDFTRFYKDVGLNWNAPTADLFAKAINFQLNSLPSTGIGEHGAWTFSALTGRAIFYLDYVRIDYDSFGRELAVPRVKVFGWRADPDQGKARLVREVHVEFVEIARNCPSEECTLPAEVRIRLEPVVAAMSRKLIAGKLGLVTARQRMKRVAESLHRAGSIAAA